jgi:hypothetical protein
MPAYNIISYKRLKLAELTAIAYTHATPLLGSILHSHASFGVKDPGYPGVRAMCIDCSKSDDVGLSSEKPICNLKSASIASLSYRVLNFVAVGRPDKPLFALWAR